MKVFPTSHSKISPPQYSSIFQHRTKIFWTHVDWYIIKRWLRQEALKHSWGLTPFIAVADCCMSIYSYPKLSPTRYSSKFQYWTLIFWSRVDWYIIKRWPKREAIKRRGGELSFNIVADWRMCIFSHPKILRQRSSFRLQYWSLIFESHVDWYIIERWPRREALKRGGGILSLNIVLDGYQRRLHISDVLLLVDGPLHNSLPA